MNINALIGLATLLAATFFLAGYAILFIQAYEYQTGLFVSSLYLLGSVFFFLYGIFVMYRSLKYPIPEYMKI